MASEKPVFKLTKCGKHYQRQLGDMGGTTTLPIKSLSKLLLMTMCESDAKCDWCKYKSPNKTKTVLVIVIRNCTFSKFKNPRFLPTVQKLYDNVGVVLNPMRRLGLTNLNQILFARFFEEFHTSNYLYEKSKQKPTLQLACFFNGITTNGVTPLQFGMHYGQKQPDEFPDDGLDRRHKPYNRKQKKDMMPRTMLLLSPYELLNNGYPLLPCEGFVFSKSQYAPVTDKSPMFGIDCERVHTVGSEPVLARVTIVNESENIVLDELVKPPCTISDYASHMSGMTVDMLQNATKTVEDIQQMIVDILPPDAILVGQSLDNDLNLLRIIHPYIIDTYKIFAPRRPLSFYTRAYLGVNIQESYGSHDSFEDALGALRLVKLRLQNGYHFGFNAQSKLTIHADFQAHYPERTPGPSASIPCLLARANKRCTVIDDTGEHIPIDNIKRYNITSVEEGVTQCKTEINNGVEMVVLSILYDDRRMESIDKAIGDLYKALPSKSLMMTVCDGHHVFYETQRGVAFIKVK